MDTDVLVAPARAERLVTTRDGGPLHPFDPGGWRPDPAADGGAALAGKLESGRVLHAAGLVFSLARGEARLLDARWSNGADKNISLEPAGATLTGASGEPRALADLAAMMARFREQATGLVGSLFPRYATALRAARTSFRPVRVEGRAGGWRRDDRRLHVDAFPSRPTRGARTLRVFANVSPREPRVWRIGPPFEVTARRFLPALRRPLPGSARLLELVGITAGRRSEYDHVMLALHDAMKRDAGYQRDPAVEEVAFVPGSAWICFSDQVAHAAIAGCFALEQTFHLPIEALYDPASAPLRTLERLLDRPLT